MSFNFKHRSHITDIEILTCRLLMDKKAKANMNLVYVHLSVEYLLNSLTVPKENILYIR
jgi:hypothetical protein